VTLTALILDLAVDGVPRLSWQFLHRVPVALRRPGRPFSSAWVGTRW